MRTKITLRQKISLGKKILISALC